MDDQPDLYSLPLEEFVAARDALARSLRRGGERDEAERVHGLRKPTPAAWAINQLARAEPDGMAALLAAGEHVREAQDGALAGHTGAGGELRAATAGQRAAIDALLAAASDLSMGGRSPSATVLERIRGTLQALAAHPELDGAATAGRLTAELSAGGGWPGAPGDGEPAAGPGPQPRPEKQAKARSKTAGKGRGQRKATDDEDERRRAEAEERRAEAAARREHEQEASRVRKEQATRTRARDLDRAERALAAATGGRRDAERALARAAEKEQTEAARVDEARRAADDAEAGVRNVLARGRS